MVFTAQLLPLKKNPWTKAGTGSGVVYKKDDNNAYIVTNNHVIEGSDAIEVLSRTGPRFKQN